VGIYPSMTHESTVGADPVRNLVMVMLQGVAMTVGDRNIRMPSFAEKFDDSQIAAVANHVVKNFGDPNAKAVSAADVAKLRAQ
jgi:mono/diheme cytochrome c family protein